MGDSPLFLLPALPDFGLAQDFDLVSASGGLLFLLRQKK